MVPNSILASPMSPTAKLVYGLILSLGRKNGCRLTNREIAKRCGLSIRRVTDILSELKQYTAIHAEYSTRGRLLTPTHVTATPQDVKCVDPSQETARPSKIKEEKLRERKKPSAPPDQRHGELAALIQKAWLSKNPDRPTCPWNGRTGTVLSRLLKDNPAWKLEDFALCLANRLDSEVNQAEEPVYWLSKLPSYASGPLNKYNKPKEKSLEQRNREHAQNLAAKWANETRPDVQSGDATGTDGGVPGGPFRLA